MGKFKLHLQKILLESLNLYIDAVIQCIPNVKLGYLIRNANRANVIALALSLPLAR